MAIRPLDLSLLPTVHGSVDTATLDIGSLEVVGQFNGEFIACMDKSQAVFLIDQHAADERAGLERLLRTCPSVSMEQPLLIARTDHLLSEEIVDHLAVLGQWGFGIRASSNDIVVDAVPSSLSRHDLGLIAAHLSRYLAEAVLDRSAPPFVLDAFKSDACHRAVKFGHKLDKAACRAIVLELAKCSFPLQCAHGRPTIVRLL